jgi:hypothetical protein
MPGGPWYGTTTWKFFTGSSVDDRDDSEPFRKIGGTYPALET